jgi:hypothetical protein
MLSAFNPPREEVDWQGFAYLKVAKSIIFQ